MIQLITTSQGLFLRETEVSSSSPLSFLSTRPGSHHIWRLFLTACRTRWVVFTTPEQFRRCQASCQSQNEVGRFCQLNLRCSPRTNSLSRHLGRKQQIKKLQKSQNQLIIRLLQVVKGVIHSDDDDGDRLIPKHVQHHKRPEKRQPAVI